ncbi:13479_t:CDS:2 [Ambispora gerdemannii]|uniref:13479_t:CDS:1 n=1 Tax=Ambispora gerdemannii TaxID=144530 RepID=A0A9N9GFE4_9GLOM|nr:13479_t:CDS:2 [Ambispora gerdemannii]
MEINPGEWGWIKQEIVENLFNMCTSSKAYYSPKLLSRTQVKDHFSHFSWTKPLKSKRVVEVMDYLFDLFHSLGSSSTIFQSDNSKEFFASHPQFQGLVEHANGILQQKLGKWREDTGRNNDNIGNTKTPNRLFDDVTIQLADITDIGHDILRQFSSPIS